MKASEIRFQGVVFEKMKREGEEEEPDDEEPQANGKMKVQGKYVICLLRNCFDFDQQLYDYYKLWITLQD